MTWLGWAGAGGITIPVLFLAFYAVRRTKSVIELYLNARLRASVEREQRATMVAMAAALPEGGVAARFEEGQSAWLFYKCPDSGQRVLTSREAA
ncbi:hypothetical protein [Streptomyces ginkgonis]|uniref:hypothetical protein n=1 Tax=Streptomyces ginkgonis TaxID=1812259 RepID=UPI002176CC9F|nr:hypothetical protein [Streptomyces ginkgonis]